MNILIKPIVTEKMTAQGEDFNRYGFVVAKDANKLQIKQAVEELFKVKVDKVRILNVKGKNKRFGGRLGKRSDMRKAYVTLSADNDIDFAGTH